MHEGGEGDGVVDEVVHLAPGEERRVGGVDRDGGQELELGDVGLPVLLPRREEDGPVGLGGRRAHRAVARVVDGRAEGAAELREGRGAPLLASSALRAPEGRVGVHEERRVGLGKEVEYERGQLGEKCLEEEEALVELRACHEGV